MAKLRLEIDTADDEIAGNAGAAARALHAVAEYVGQREGATPALQVGAGVAGDGAVALDVVETEDAAEVYVMSEHGDAYADLGDSQSVQFSESNLGVVVTVALGGDGLDHPTGTPIGRAVADLVDGVRAQMPWESRVFAG